MKFWVMRYCVLFAVGTTQSRMLGYSFRRRRAFAIRAPICLFVLVPIAHSVVVMFLASLVIRFSFLRCRIWKIPKLFGAGNTGILSESLPRMKISETISVLSCWSFSTYFVLGLSVAFFFGLWESFCVQ